MSEPGIENSFGCDLCWPADADAAYRAFANLVTEYHLIDESHFIVTIRFCRACSQRFISVFTETIDWMNGEDPQERTILPITPVEVNDLLQQSQSLTEGKLESLGVGRRSLYHNFPSSGARISRWTSGILVGQHD